jgi:hypothetical protein
VFKPVWLDLDIWIEYYKILSPCEFKTIIVSTRIPSIFIIGKDSDLRELFTDVIDAIVVRIIVDENHLIIIMGLITDGRETVLEIISTIVVDNYDTCSDISFTHRLVKLTHDIGYADPCPICLILIDLTSKY